MKVIWDVPLHSSCINLQRRLNTRQFVFIKATFLGPYIYISTLPLLCYNYLQAGFFHSLEKSGGALGMGIKCVD